MDDLRWLNTTGPVTKDVTLSSTGRRWNNTSSVVDVAKLNSYLSVPSFPISGSLTLWQDSFPLGVNFAIAQFNYSVYGNFTLDNPTTQFLPFLQNYSNVFLAIFGVIRFRVGSVA